VQAVAGRGENDRSIRVAVTGSEPLLRVVVTDSGAGFVEAARVFEPFYTIKQPGRGQGTGLAVSYNIVREHGGEISAFNVHPHGAAVVVELPVAKTVVDMGELQGAGIRD
jgi:C4-dicarboxylate-specific signal transduction histidine kinase